MLVLQDLFHSAFSTCFVCCIYVVFFQCVPYLMAMSTDPDSKIKAKADQHLIDHTSRYGHLMQVRTECSQKQYVASNIEFSLCTEFLTCFKLSRENN